MKLLLSESQFDANKTYQIPFRLQKDVYLEVMRYTILTWDFSDATTQTVFWLSCKVYKYEIAQFDTTQAILYSIIFGRKEETHKQTYAQTITHPHSHETTHDEQVCSHIPPFHWKACWVARKRARRDPPRWWSSRRCCCSLAFRSSAASEWRHRPPHQWPPCPWSSAVAGWRRVAARESPTVITAPHIWATEAHTSANNSKPFYWLCADCIQPSRHCRRWIINLATARQHGEQRVNIVNQTRSDWFSGFPSVCEGSTCAWVNNNSSPAPARNSRYLLNQCS